MAGGFLKAKKILRNEIKNATNLLRISTFMALTFAGCSIYVMLQKYKRYKEEIQLLKNIELQKNLSMNKMPSIRAEEMDTHCQICMTHPSNIILVPCNHLCICQECFKKLKDGNIARRGLHNSKTIECPICRRQADSNQQI